MQRSTDRILTTHTGSLPRPADLVELLNDKEAGESYEKAAFDQRIRRAVAEIVKQQTDCGIDIVNDGEHSKVNWMAYARGRLSGLEEIDAPVRFRGATRDSTAFPGAYEDMKIMLAARSGSLVPKRKVRPRAQICSGPIRYVGQDELKTDIENLKLALGSVGTREAFMTAISLSNLELYYENKYYKSDEEYLAALADAMRVEYQAIVDAGLILQMDDLELKHFVDLMLRINASAYLIEAANPRHEHEWQLWQEVKLPHDKILVPGVVSHCIHLVEHPELVAQRIMRFAGAVGRERVIAGTDCGFGTSGGGDEVHPEVAWAKLAALVEGARLASQRLYRS